MGELIQLSLLGEAPHVGLRHYLPFLTATENQKGVLAYGKPTRRSILIAVVGRGTGCITPANVANAGRRQNAGGFDTQTGKGVQHGQ